MINKKVSITFLGKTTVELNGNIFALYNIDYSGLESRLQSDITNNNFAELLRMFRKTISERK